VRARFFLRRSAMLVATLVVSSFVIFSALYLAPGNPIAVLSGGRTLPAASIKVLEARYHLNDPFLTQYWLWL
jgi:peptide/nickel transport system permease protein